MVNTENIHPAEGQERPHDQPEVPGQLRNDFGRRRLVPESGIPNQADSLEDVRQELASMTPPSDSTFQSSLHFPLYRFDNVRAYRSSEERQKHFIDNVTALRNLSGDAPLTSRNPILRAGSIILDIIRYPINPIDNARRVKESAKRTARKLPFTKNLRILREIPEDQAATLSKDPQKAEKQIATSLLQMRRDALPYDGRNFLTRWIVNKYAKANINMPAAKALFWFGMGNIPLIGFLISSGKLYMPNVVAPLYDRKLLRAGKTLALTATDFAANIFQSARAVVMTHGVWDLFATQGIGRGLLALPGYLLSNWEILAPFPIILAYNPLFIQGRLDQNDYRNYARHFEGMSELLWNDAEAGRQQVINGVQGMLEDYGKHHHGRPMYDNAIHLVKLMQSEYAALVGRLADEDREIRKLHDSLSNVSPEHHARETHRVEEKIASLSLRNKAHRARLLYIENLYLLMQETGHLAPNRG